MSYQNQIHGVLLMVYIDFHTLIFHWSSVGYVSLGIHQVAKNQHILYCPINFAKPQYRNNECLQQTQAGHPSAPSMIPLLHGAVHLTGAHVSCACAVVVCCVVVR